MGAFIHIANVIFLISYAVRDIMRLRILTVLALSCLISYFYFQPEPLWAAIGWTVLSIGINLYQIYRLALERRPIQLTDNQRSLYELCFGALEPRDMLKLLEHSSSCYLKTGEVLVEQGVTLDRMMVLVEGTASVRVDGEEVATLNPGQFVGEMSFLTDHRSTAAVVAKAPLRYIRWRQDVLKTLLTTSPDLRAGVQRIIGMDLVAKLGSPRRDCLTWAVDRPPVA